MVITCRFPLYKSLYVKVWALMDLPIQSAREWQIDSIQQWPLKHILIGHLHKTKSPGGTGKHIYLNVRGNHFTVWLKKIYQILVFYITVYIGNTNIPVFVYIK